MTSLPPPPLLKRITAGGAGNDGSLPAEVVVRLLYRSLLGREADPVGQAHYAEMLRSRSIDEPALASILIGSPEYRNAADVRAALAGHVQVQSHGCTFLIPEDPILLAELQAPEGYEPWVLPYFLEQCRPGATVLDIGASIGAFSLPAALRVGESGCIYAVEASPFNCRMLAQSIALNHFGNVELLPFGVSDSLGHATMARQLHTNNNALDAERPATPSDLVSHDIIPVIPLDLLRPKLRKIDILKLDIEGMEYRACRGAEELIKGDRPLVFLEYSPRLQKMLSGVSGRDLLLFFSELGYVFEILHRDRPRYIVSDADPVETIERSWHEHVGGGGSHLDLCVHPVDPLSSM